MSSLIGWIRSWFSTIKRSEVTMSPTTFQPVYGVRVNGKDYRLTFSHERMMDMGQISGVEVETAVIILLRADIFAATGILFSERRIRNAGK